MKSLDVSQLDSTNSLVPNAGEQDNTSSSDSLQFFSPDSNHSGSNKVSSISDDLALNVATCFATAKLIPNTFLGTNQKIVSKRSS